MLHWDANSLHPGWWAGKNISVIAYDRGLHLCSGRGLEHCRLGSHNPEGLKVVSALVVEDVTSQGSRKLV